MATEYNSLHVTIGELLAQLNDHEITVLQSAISSFEQKWIETHGADTSPWDDKGGTAILAAELDAEYENRNKLRYEDMEEIT